LNCTEVQQGGILFYKKLFFIIVLLDTSVNSDCSEKSSQAIVVGENSEEQQALKATIRAPKSPAILPSILLAKQQKDNELITWETVDTLLAQIQKTSTIYGTSS